MRSIMPAMETTALTAIMTMDMSDLEKNIVNKTGCFGFIPGETDSKLSSTTYYCAGYADGKLKVDRDRVQPIND